MALHRVAIAMTVNSRIIAQSWGQMLSVDDGAGQGSDDTTRANKAQYYSCSYFLLKIKLSVARAADTVESMQVKCSQHRVAVLASWKKDAAQHRSSCLASGDPLQMQRATVEIFFLRGAHLSPDVGYRRRNTTRSNCNAVGSFLRKPRGVSPNCRRTREVTYVERCAYERPTDLLAALVLVMVRPQVVTLELLVQRTPLE